MIRVSRNYDNIIANGGHYEWRVYNNETTFGMEHIVSGSIQYQGWNKQTIGNVISAQLNLTLWNVTIDTNYPIYMQFRATDGTNNSPWYAQSGFYVDTMQTNPYTQMTEITAFDGLLKSETDYMPNGSFVPITAKDLAEQIATDIGLSLNAAARNWLNLHPYTFSVAPNVGVGGTTDKEMLSYIATIYGANWVVRGNTIDLVYPQYSPEYTADVGNAVARLKKSDTEVVKRIKLWLDYETYFLAPQMADEDAWAALGGRCIEARLPFYASQSVADNLATEYGIGGSTRSFIPYEADKVYIDPKYEVGDGVRFATDALSFTSRIASMTINIDPLSASKLEFEAEDTLNSLYPYITKVERDMIYEIGQTQTEVANANSREQTIYISKASGTSSVSANTTWVTNSSGSQNTWTTTRPVYDSSYPVLFVATQRQSVEQSSGTTCSCTTPVKDQTTTVIDGGHITTGTIDASVVNVTNINADNITSGTIDAININGSTITGSTLESTSSGGSIKIADGSIDFYENATTTGTPFSQLSHVYNSSLNQHAIEWRTTGYTKLINEEGGQWTADFIQFALNPQTPRLMFLIYPDSDGTYARFDTDFVKINGSLSAENGMVCKTSSAYGNVNFQKTTDTSRGLSVSTVTWTNSNQMYFNIFHRANDVNSSYVDQYWLPESGTDNANHTYNILTTKGAGELSGLTSSHTINASKMYAIPIGNYCRIVEVNAVITLTSAVSNGSKILNGIPIPLTGAGWYFKPLRGSNAAGTGYELKYGADSGDTYGNVQSAQSIASGSQVRMHFTYFARP